MAVLERGGSERGGDRKEREEREERVGERGRREGGRE